MSEDEYQAVIREWLDDMEKIDHDVREFQFAHALNDEAQDHIEDLKGMTSRLLERMDRFVWTDARGLRDWLFGEINIEAQRAVKRAKELVEVAQAEARAEADAAIVQFKREYDRQHDQLRARLQMEDKARREVHRKAMADIDAEVERRVRDRIYAIGDEGKRPARPIRIGT